MNTSNYPALFRLQLQRSLSYLGRQLEELAHRPADHPLIDLILHTLDFALDITELWPQSASLLLELIPSIEHRGRYNNWITYLSRGIEQAKHSGDVRGIAEMQFHLGMGYLAQGQPQEAHNLFQASYQFFETHADVERTARSLNGLARTAHQTGDTQTAITYAYRALHLATGHSTIEQATSYRLLGMIAFDQREWERALTFFEQDLALCQLPNQRRQVAFGLVNVGSVLRALGKATDAITIYKEAIALFEAEADQVNIAAAQLNLGNVYLGLKQFESALEVYRDADWTLRDVNNAPRLAMLYNNMGMALTGLGQWEQAEAFYRKSIDRWHALQNERARVNVMDNLGELYLTRGNYKQAREILIEAQRVAETLNDTYLLELVKTHLAMT